MAQWHAKRTGGYSRTTTEAKDNAEMCYGVLNSLGWCLEAVAAILGNQEGESVYNPWRWQGDNVLNYGDYRIGEIPPPLVQYGCAYGLFQQDPAAKYLKRPYKSNKIGQSGGTCGLDMIASRKTSATIWMTLMML